MVKRRSELALLGLTLFAQLLIVTLTPAIVAIDVMYFGTAVDESSLTERVQELLVLLSALTYGSAAFKYPESRGALILIAGLMACMFIREKDAVFDQIQHGAWVWPAWVVALGTLGLAYLNKATVLSAVLTFRRQSFFAYLSLGLLLLLGFSRIFGTGALWEAVTQGGAATDGRIKTAVQEGLELLGYALIFYSAVVFYVQNIFVSSEACPNSP